MIINIITLFPAMFDGFLGDSIPKRAIEKGAVKYNIFDLRDYSDNKHNKVDDVPYGGGPGMLITANVIDNCLNSISSLGEIVYMSPRGELLNQEIVKNDSKKDVITIICGRYEGIDQRVIDEWNIREISIGDFILSGGEIAACAYVDALTRILPNVLGDSNSFEDESFDDGLLEYPQYTRPRVWKDREVPTVLTSGNHKLIENWKLEQKINITKERRLDLWGKSVHYNRIK